MIHPVIVLLSVQILLVEYFPVSAEQDMMETELITVRVGVLTTVNS